MAGWLRAFRHRAYLGWLGLAFLMLSGSILAHDKVKVALELGAAAPQMRLAAQALLVVCAVCFLLAAVMAVSSSVVAAPSLATGASLIPVPGMVMVAGALSTAFVSLAV